MDHNRLRDTGKDGTPCRIAWFHLTDGTDFPFQMSAGCEQFVGRFARLPDLRHSDHIIRFGDPVLADGKLN